MHSTYRQGTKISVLWSWTTRELLNSPTKAGSPRSENYAMALPDEEQDRFWNLCKDEAEYRADRASIYKVYVETL